MNAPAASRLGSTILRSAAGGNFDESFFVYRNKRATESGCLRFAELTLAAAIGSADPVGMCHYGKNKRVDKQDSCGENEQKVFHGFSPC
jgi:hypothetical protein